MMMQDGKGDDSRPGEHAIDFDGRVDAGVTFIGRIETPWTSRSDCPRQGREDGPICRIHIFDPWANALEGVASFSRVEALYWLHLARRDLVLQCPRGSAPRGTFALRSPVRPNPIGSSIVKLECVSGQTLFVRGLDCVDGTPLLDVKPERSFSRL
jgi:tRNA-Thr(GGU) m(6)t(6)A37 methyltransferase TsaA